MSDRSRVILSIVTRLIVSILLIGIGIATLLWLVQTRTPPTAAPLEQARLRVTAIEVDPVLVQRQFQGFGTAEAYQAANVPAEVRGIVVEVPDHIVAGATVEQGQLIARLNDEDYQRERDIIVQQIAEVDAQLSRLQVESRAVQRRLELAQEEVELAQSDLQRAEEALATDGALQREVDQLRQVLFQRQREVVAMTEQLESIDPRQAQLQASLAQLRVSQQQAERNIARTRITSPIDGVLQSVGVDEGESVQIDQQIARVVDLRLIEVPIRLPSESRRHLEPGADVDITTSSDSEWTATLDRIAPEDDEESRTVTVYIMLEQDPADPSRPLLAPGQFVRAVVEASQEELRQVVPRRSLVADRIRTVQDGIVQSQRVEVDFQVRARFADTGLADNTWLVLSEPLEPGTLIVVEGNRRIPDGTPVQPVAPNGTEFLALDDARGKAGR